MALKLVDPDVITRGCSLLHHVILMIFSLRSFSRTITGGARVAALCLMRDSQLVLKDVKERRDLASRGIFRLRLHLVQKGRQETSELALREVKIVLLLRRLVQLLMNVLEQLDGIASLVTTS